LLEEKPMAHAPATPAAPVGPVFAVVTLDSPIMRGSLTIDTVTLRKPRSGELRGLSIAPLANLDVDEIRKLLPRISDPILTTADVDNLDPADLLQMGGEIVDFLLPKAKRPAFPVQ